MSVEFFQFALMVRLDHYLSSHTGQTMIAAISAEWRIHSMAMPKWSIINAPKKDDMIEGVWVGDGKILVCAGGGGTQHSAVPCVTTAAGRGTFFAGWG